MAQTGFAKVASDITQLCELQSQLLFVDLEEARKSAVPASALLAACGISLLVAALVLVFAFGMGLHEMAGLAWWQAFGITGAITLLVAAATAWLGLRSLKKATDAFDDSRQELRENINWLRATILDPESPRNQMALRKSRPVNGATVGQSRFY